MTYSPRAEVPSGNPEGGQMVRVFQISSALAVIGLVLAAANPWTNPPVAVELVWLVGLIGVLVTGPVLLWRRWKKTKGLSTSRSDHRTRTP